MPLFPRKIDVVVLHTLGKDLAEAKLLKLAQESKKNPNISLIDSTWSQITHTATFTISAMGNTVHGRVTITDDTVRLDTDNLPLVATGPVVWYYQSLIQAKLAKALT